MVMSRLEPTSWSVVLGAAAGDHPKREEFSRRYEAIVRSYLSFRWSVHQTHGSVEDGVQEVLLECLKPNGALARLDRSKTTDFRGYLYGVTRRTAIVLERRWRREARDRSPDTARALRIERDVRTLSAVFDRTWTQMLCTEALSLCRDRLAQLQDGALKSRCLQKRYLEDLPPREIARELGVDATVVYEALKRAKELYEACLLEVLGSYQPEATRAELIGKCEELATGL